MDGRDEALAGGRLRKVDEGVPQVVPAGPVHRHVDEVELIVELRCAQPLHEHAARALVRQVPEHHCRHRDNLANLLLLPGLRGGRRLGLHCGVTRLLQQVSAAAADREGLVALLGLVNLQADPEHEAPAVALALLRVGRLLPQKLRLERPRHGPERQPARLPLQLRARRPNLDLNLLGPGPGELAALAVDGLDAVPGDLLGGPGGVQREGLAPDHVATLCLGGHAEDPLRPDARAPPDAAPQAAGELLDVVPLPRKAPPHAADGVDGGVV
mmetsp:Transcript_9456/g.20712  ORF Transcript_9456/g.20712 Transcript_9456/m.20712 type:complete len:270 (-) Transcript_9456:334-1143(-)